MSQIIIKCPEHAQPVNKMIRDISHSKDLNAFFITFIVGSCGIWENF